VAWREIVAGRLHTCGVTTDGTAYCWGINAEGQLGTGTTGAISTTPVAVSGGLRFSAIRASGGIAGFLRDYPTLGESTFTCGIQAGTGQLYCWGSSRVGQVGDDGNTYRAAPVALRQP
jgi:alpha-tubulin suppressor-like RCC1 family protein